MTMPSDDDDDGGPRMSVAHTVIEPRVVEAARGLMLALPRIFDTEAQREAFSRATTAAVHAFSKGLGFSSEEAGVFKCSPMQMLALGHAIAGFAASRLDAELEAPEGTYARAWLLRDAVEAGLVPGEVLGLRRGDDDEQVQ